MTITLTVSEVRQELQRAAGRKPAGEGSPTTALLGTMFHRVIGELLQDDTEWNLASVVKDLEPDPKVWKKVLTGHAYDRLLGPLLTRQAASLRDQGTQVMNLWTAVRNAAQWFAELWWQVTEQGTRSVRLNDWFQVESQIVRDLRQPGWTEPVSLLGQLDAVLRIPGRDHWCILEWKLGQTSPEVDTAQACLYHLLLTGEESAHGASALAVVSFHPARHETLFQSTQIAESQARLLDLIGQTAGVTGPRSARAAAVTSASDPIADAQNPSAGIAASRSATASRQTPNQATQPITPTPTIQSTPSVAWLTETRDRILRVLRKFGVACRESRPPLIGPAFVRFSLFPDGGIRQKKVLSGAPELHLHLGLPAEPVMSVVDGTIAIDIPNPQRETVAFSSLLPCLPEIDETLGCSRVPVGIDLSRTWVWCDLAGSESPHMLVVGTPGSGKSQWLRAAVAALIRTNTPNTLQLLLIDPKQNAFTFAVGSAFLSQPIVVPDGDTEVSEILEGLVLLMEARYSEFAVTKSQSLADHVRSTGVPLPRIICICDEYADLLEGSDKAERQAIEKQLRRISAKGRAAGVHLILATQQPRASIVTPAIRAMLPVKVALRVSDARESRIALDEAGAERLLGNGDLLFRSIGTRRLQGAWLPADEETLATGGSCAAVSAEFDVRTQTDAAPS